MAEVKPSFFDKFGNYPKEYNKKVHGPYYPWVNYGAKDTPIWDVKLGELKPWLQRRNKAPYAAIATVSRYLWKYKVDWFETKHGSPVKGMYHVMIAGSLISMIGCYSYLKTERLHKYHW